MHLFGIFHYLGDKGMLAPPALSAAASLHKSQYASQSQWHSLQAAKLQRLTQAAANTKYYSEHPGQWLNAIRTAGPDSLEACLAQIPILSKLTIRAQGTRMLNRAFPTHQLRWSVTGGSTGEPLRIAHNKQARIMATAAAVRGFAWAGIQPGDRTMNCRAFDRTSFLGRLRSLASHVRIIDSLGANRPPDADIIHQLHTFKPRCLVGYPTALLRLAQIARPAQLHIPVVFCTGEAIYPAQREFLHAVFDCQVRDYYGCNEINSLAYECEHGQKHITAEHVILETVDDHGQPVWDQPGRILVTDLDNTAMPMLRYELGDLGVLTRDPCPCGRTLPVLKHLEGRCQDVLRNARGDIVPAMAFAEESRHLTSIPAYQFVQTTVDHITFRYVPAGAQHAAEATRLCQRITQQLGPITIHTERCLAIPLTPRGKTRLVVGMEPAPQTVTPRPPDTIPAPPR